MVRSWFRGGHGRALALTLAVAVVFITPVPARAAAAAAPEPPPTGSWTLPVGGPIGRRFEAPASRYGPGHRGVDFGAPAGAPVGAAGDGVVTFAGPVAGALHVVVAHAGNLRTSYSFLATVAVRRGDRIRRGDVVGTAGGPAGDHAPGVHLGLRIGGEYVDPMLLFRPPDLSRIVHLAPARHGRPVAGGSWTVEALGVARGLDLAGHGLTTNADAPAGSELLSTVGAWFERAAGAGTALGRRFPGAPDAAAALDRLRGFARARLDCTASPPAADRSGGSGHLLMAVGGIDSSTDPETGATFGLPPGALGYRADEVRWFSYAADGGPYSADDTHGGIRSAALRLARQLRTVHERDPGREIDLVAHSQGGVVVDAFLQHVYDASDPAYPPIGTVVTLSSPHRGAPLAAAGLGVPTGAASLVDLREDSRTMRELWRHRLPEQIDFTTIGAVDDVVVPASRTGVPGATEVLVNPRGPLDHSAVTHDAEALAAVRLALEGRPPPCPDPALAVRGAVEPLLITRLERAVGSVGRAAAGAVDAARDVLGGVLP